MNRKRAAVGFVLAVAAMVIWAALAPRERTLGDGIRVVYVHVGFTWVGMIGIYLAGALGLVQLFRPRERLEEWSVAIGRAGVGMFTIGFVLSLIAAKVNWGGILWAEPRVAASLGITVAGLIAAVIGGVVTSGRWAGPGWVLLAVYTGWSLQTVQAVFHPERAIEPSMAPGIAAAFAGSFVFALLAGAMATLLLRSAASHPSSAA